MSIAEERRRAGPLPLWDLPDWYERFGVHAGIAGGKPDGAPFDLGLWGRQPAGDAMAHWRAFQQAFPDCGRTVLAHQVHGARVLWHDAEPEPGWLLLDGADGHATTASGTLLTVTVADCIPVYLIVPARRAIALLHAGWRGTASGILARGVDLLCTRARAAPANVVMHCGVGICGSCYEVGREVMDGVGVPTTGEGPWQLDLRAVLARQGDQLGVGEITSSPWCSAHDAGFFSHRRSRGTDGRMVAYLGLPLGEPGGPVDG